mmetsp:Transcript_2760/g.6955  ORF Transcript_2760/g.6955 Transcript_2760/m.6955 type:complete len:292 (+) Transcript_2760:177-1052(+)
MSLSLQLSPLTMPRESFSREGVESLIVFVGAFFDLHDVPRLEELSPSQLRLVVVHLLSRQRLHLLVERRLPLCKALWSAGSAGGPFPCPPLLLLQCQPQFRLRLVLNHLVHAHLVLHPVLGLRTQLVYHRHAQALLHLCVEDLREPVDVGDGETGETLEPQERELVRILLGVGEDEAQHGREGAGLGVFVRLDLDPVALQRVIVQPEVLLLRVRQLRYILHQNRLQRLYFHLLFHSVVFRVPVHCAGDFYWGKGVSLPQQRNSLSLSQRSPPCLNAFRCRQRAPLLPSLVP